MKKLLVGILASAMLASGSLAANVTIDGEVFQGAKLRGSVTYVPIREFSNELSECTVSWDGSKKIATVNDETLEFSARIGDGYATAGGRYLYTGNENIISGGKTYVPIRTIAKALGAEVKWDNESRTAVVEKERGQFLSADEFYDAEDLYWLSKIISAESSGESLEGKIAVGNVVLNRVRSSEYPNSVYEVIFDKKNGVQFTPVATGTIYNEPTEESIMAAKICLEDYKLSQKDILFFLNPQISTSAWIPNNREFVMTIGRHDFYA